MNGNIVRLPRDFIGAEDEQRLESFGGRLIAHGRATRWHWNRKRGIDVAFEIFSGGADEALSFSIKRDRDNDVFYVTDAAGKRIGEGKLDHVMAVIDKIAAAQHPDAPA